MTRIVLLSLGFMVVAASLAPAQALRRPYGAFDAIEEGTANNEARRLQAIGSQLDTNDRLRSLVTDVRRPRVVAVPDRNTHVYAYGRRGILGLRPQGYVVVRRQLAPAPPRMVRLVPSPPVYDDYPYRDFARQPVGHESVQTGPRTWEYWPLYEGNLARDDAGFAEPGYRSVQTDRRLNGRRDDTRVLRSQFAEDADRRNGRLPSAREQAAARSNGDTRVEDRGYRGRARASSLPAARRPAQPETAVEELPMPQPARGRARDIARDSESERNELLRRLNEARRTTGGSVIELPKDQDEPTEPSRAEPPPPPMPEDEDAGPALAPLEKPLPDEPTPPAAAAPELEGPSLGNPRGQ